MSRRETSLEWVGEVLSFWFEELKPKQWFSSADELDAQIKARFEDRVILLQATPVSQLGMNAEHALAAIITLDQFSRNIFRGTRQAFTQDAKALEIAKLALERGFDEGLSDQQKHFMYMPFMHSEELADHERSLELFGSLNSEDTLKFAQDHYDTIREFGRYPYRNKVMGRESTPEELEYLKNASTYGQ